MMPRFNKGIYGKLLNELCKMNWSFQVIYDHDEDYHRIEFVYRNGIAAISNEYDAKEWLRTLKQETCAR